MPEDAKKKDKKKRPIADGESGKWKFEYHSHGLEIGIGRTKFFRFWVVDDVDDDDDGGWAATRTQLSRLAESSISEIRIRWDKNKTYENLIFDLDGKFVWLSERQAWESTTSSMNLRCLKRKAPAALEFN